MTTVTINTLALKSALKQLQGIEDFADKKNKGKRGRDFNSDWLYISCASYAAIQDLIGYLELEDLEKLKGTK